MKKRIFKFFAGTGFLLLTSTINAQQWQSNGPYGGPVHALALQNGSVFSGTNNGVFRSADEGQHWTAANSGLELKTITALAVKGSKVFAGAYNDGIYLSNDNGVSWMPRNYGLTAF